jgi:hypothetical protein
MNNIVRLTLDALTGVTVGISAKEDILGKDVYNDQSEKVGVIEDVLIAPDDKTTYGIVGVGGFLGIGRRSVAVPVDFFQENSDGQWILYGATKDLLKQAPEFSYS